MLSCKQFVEQSSQIIDNEVLSLSQRINNKIHMLICLHCRRYIKQAKLSCSAAKDLELEPPASYIVESNVAEMQNFSANNQ